MNILTRRLNSGGSYRLATGFLAVGFWIGTAGFLKASVILLEGDPVAEKVVSIGEDGIRIEGVSEPVPLGGILRVENAEVAGEKSSESAALYLVGGGRVPVGKLSFDVEEEAFEVEVAGAGAQKLSIDVVGAVLLNPKADRARFDEVRSEPTTEFDRVLIDVGAEIQVIRGLLDGFGVETITLDVDGESRDFPRDKVTGIVLASVPPEVPESWVEVVGVNGSVFTGESVTLDEAGSLAVHLGAGDPLKLPWTSVARVEFFSPRIAFLSDSKPVSSSRSPIVALPRDPQLGSNVLGGDLVIGGRIYRRGIGMPGGSEITFEAEGFERFKAVVGVDDAAAGRGDCVVLVVAGDQELFRAQIKGGEPPKLVNIDLGGAEEITLKVLPGVDLDLADYADWGDAVLVRDAE